MSARRGKTFVACAVVALVALAPGRAAAETATIDDYRSRVSQARTLVEELAPTADSEAVATRLAAELGALLPASERVRVGSVTIDVDTSIPRSMLERLEAADEPVERKDAAADLLRYATSLERSLGEVGAARVQEDPGALARLVAESHVRRRSAVTEWVGKLVERAGRWLADRLGRLGGRVSPAVTTVMLGAILAVLAAGLGLAAAAALRAARRSTAFRETVIAAPGPEAVVVEAEGLPPDALAHADTLAAAGRTREAVRALFGGAARSLAAAGLVPATRARTTAELLADATSASPAAAASLGELAQRFEVAWYGHVDPGSEGYAAARASYGTLAQLVPPQEER